MKRTDVSIVQTLHKHAQAIRNDVIAMTYASQAAHLGGALSCIEILTVLYFRVLSVYPKQAYHPARDRFVLSKGHAGKTLYATLANRGFFSRKILAGYEADNGLLPGHSTRNCAPGVEVSTGSLGHGLSMSSGMAYAAKLKNEKHTVFTLLSDGECDSGATWEAILFAGHHKLDNLVAIVDYNKLQGFGYTKDIIDLEPLAKKFESFGWSVREVDGHDIRELLRVFNQLPFAKSKPSVVIAHTIKGFGGPKQHVGQVTSHYKPPTEDDMKQLHIKSKIL